MESRGGPGFRTRRELPATKISAWPASVRGAPSGRRRRAPANYAGEDDGWSSKITGYTDGSKYTAKVGSYPPNRLGIFDLGGNVWEWCEDWYDGERKARVLRGASFLNEFPAVLLSSSRFNHAPDGRHDNFGFRCVVVVGGSAP